MIDSTRTKADLRRSLLKARQALSAASWREKSDRLSDHLKASSQFAQAQTILSYFSIRQEPDLSLLLSEAKQWGFPRCVDRALVWHHWSPQSELPLQTGTFGIQEPHPDCPVIEPDQVDLILVPAVACDMRGYRLGYGGGFYDRLLSSPAWAEKFTIGIVFESAYVSELPSDPWDVPLRAVCTETGVTVF